MATIVESLSGVKPTTPYQEESYTLKNHVYDDSTITVNYTLNGVPASWSFSQGVSYTYMDSHAKGQYDGDKTFNFCMFQDGDVLVLNDIEYRGSYTIYGFKEDKSKVEIFTINKRFTIPANNSGSYEFRDEELHNYRASQLNIINIEYETARQESSLGMNIKSYPGSDDSITILKNNMNNSGKGSIFVRKSNSQSFAMIFDISITCMVTG